MLVQVTFPLAAANVMNQAARTVMAIVCPPLLLEPKVPAAPQSL